MSAKDIKTICFFTRRYDDLLKEDVFSKKFHNQYFWVKHLDSDKFNCIWIFGAAEDRQLNHELGKIYFVKDFKRTKLLLEKASLYKKSKNIIEKENVNLVICNGMNDISSHHLLSKKLGSNTPTILQDHASTYNFKYSLVSSFFKELDGFIFNSVGQEEEWVKAKLIDKEKVYFLPEGVSEFQAINKDTARAKTKLNGDPIFLWVGNLVDLKDPMTCLKGIKEVVKDKTSLRLYMIYQKDTLIDKVKSFIAENKLENNIILLGSVKHEEIESYFQSADFFISSSLKEGSGYAAIEAMACNTIPILSDIPSFKDFTNSGKVGRMFEKAKVEDLKTKILELLERDQLVLKNELQSHYQSNFSPSALANKFSDCIQSILHDS